MPAHLIIEKGPNQGQIFSLEEREEWTIGKDPENCQLVLDDENVSRKHARLTRTQEGFVLKNLSRSHPTKLNDVELKKPALLQEADRIQIGESVFLFREQENSQQEEEPKPSKKKKAAQYDDIFGQIEEESFPPLENESRREEESVEIPPSPPKPEMSAYDTIFEDSEAEEDLPFHLIPELPLMLKVIAGPNAGAEIGLEKGNSYTIGKDPNSCDIVFQDVSVSRHHAKLDVESDGSIEIEDLGSKNGTAVNGSLLFVKTKITPQDLISVGTTVFLIIDRDAPQETIYSPMVSSPEPIQSKEEREEPLGSIESAKKHWKLEPIPPKYLVIAGSAAAIFLVMFLSFFSLFTSQSIELAEKEPSSEIKEALAKFSDVQFSFNPASGKLFLVGHVLSNTEYQEMKYRLSQVPPISSIEETVIIDEGVWKTMNDILSENPSWRGVSIHSPAAGKFVVNGYLSDSNVKAQLDDYLTMNFPYLDRLENLIVVEQELNTELQAKLMSQNLAGVTFQLSNGTVIFSGAYNEKKEAEYKKFLKDLNSIKGIAAVKNFAIPIHPDLAGIDVSQEYAVSGSSSYEGKGFSVVMNGKLYTLGDKVDGMKITSIDPHMILLEKDGLRYKINYTQ